jgi:FKBP-type peptidyl-prolyl cis-trans isomerase FkpA
MKQKIFTFLLIAVTGLTACRKTNVQPDRRQFDESEIQKYISANGLTDFTADTSGMHYKIISHGSGDSLKYSDAVSLVYTLRTFDGKFVQSDTITNHISAFLGHLTAANPANSFSLPYGMQLAVHDLLKYRDGSMRVLIPSRLGYGVNGYGSGSASNVNTRIAGNQGLDIYVHVIKNQDIYDYKLITNYLAANNLSGYSKDFVLVDSLGIQTPKYYYYKIITPGTGTAGEIKEFSNVNGTYVGSLLNGYEFDNGNKTTATTTALVPYTLVTGVSDALTKHAVTGTSISMFIPSVLGYGASQRSSGATITIPLNSILHFEFQITTVTQP